MPQPHGAGPAAGREIDAVRRRRDFIKEHHPDRGGDPGFFAAGMRAFDAGHASEPLPRVIIVRHRPWLVRLAATLVRQLRHERKPPRVH